MIPVVSKIQGQPLSKNPWVPFSLPSSLQNQKDNQNTIIWTSSYFTKENTLFVIHSNPEGFFLYFPSPISLSNFLFEIKLNITVIEGSFLIQLLIKNPGLIFISSDGPKILKENSMQTYTIEFSEKHTITSSGRLNMHPIQIQGFYIQPITKKIIFYINNIYFRKKIFLYLEHN